MIDVIIPAYNAHKTIERTLFSISYQENIKEVKTYIVNDKSDKDYSEEVNFFSKFMNIKEIKLEKNGGPGIARQEGINNSYNPYIVFIDSDDVFASPMALKTLYNSIVKTNADVVISNFMEEKMNKMVRYAKDNVWLHGKIYKREFLKKHRIMFNNTRANEDNGFNQSIFLRDSKIEYIDDITYYWCYNPNSLTRINNYEYNFSGLEGYIDNIIWALEGAIQENESHDKIANLAWAVLARVYCYYVEFIDNNDVEILLKKSKRLKQICLAYQMEDIKKQEGIMLNSIKNADNIDQILIKPPISLSEFIKKIEEV